jgi:drug/metabolite transporter (DMT)-like permease
VTDNGVHPRGAPAHRNFRLLHPHTALLTAAAMIAFAANSVLCRLALGAGSIDAASFTSVRVISGAVVLVALVTIRRGGFTPLPANWRTVLALFAYMAFFSFAYLSLSAGTGALILFGAVQLTMFVAGLRGGERFSPLSWAGLALALFGLIYLVAPGVTAPDPFSASLMTVAGIAWGFYSLLGRGAANPLQATAANFVWCVPPVLLLSLVFLGDIHASATGIALAVASGAVASGLGYAVWYAALPALSATRAATVQLSVPAIAAFAGVALLGEDVTLRLLVASIATLGGIAIVLAQKSAKS